MCYNSDNLLPITDNEGNFIDFCMNDGKHIITDYSRMNLQIIAKGKKHTLGNPKTKKEIKSIDGLENCIRTLFQTAEANELRSFERAAGDAHILSYRNLDPEISVIVNLLIHQVMFDVLYYRYLVESPELTLQAYCKKYVCYDWELREDEDEVGDEKRIDKTRKWMRTEIDREVSVYSNEEQMKGIANLGNDPNKYIEFLGRLNEPYSEYEKKSKCVWDYIYYSGHPDLITSIQSKRSLNRINKSGKRNNNYSAKKLELLFRTYDHFISRRFLNEPRDSKDYYEQAMDFYHLEIYKRVDYMYKLAVHMELTGMTHIDKNNAFLKRFHPTVFYPIIQENNIYYDHKNKYYRPMLMLEQLWMKSSFDNDTRTNVIPTFNMWYNCYYIRAKTYELFDYNNVFVADNYDEIVAFIKAHYNILEYHVPNKEWIQGGEGKERKNKTRIKNAIKINDALFEYSEKLNSVK